jgi:hypothetical protein
LRSNDGSHRGCRNVYDIITNENSRQRTFEVIGYVQSTFGFLITVVCLTFDSDFVKHRKGAFRSRKVSAAGYKGNKYD